MALISPELKPWEEYIHIICLCFMLILMFISGYEVCASSINDQPRIKYRFTTMLFCFVQLIVTFLATLYFIIPSNNKYRLAMGLLMRLCLVLGRILGVLCCYSFLLTIVKSLYRTPTYRRKIPRWFRGCTKIFCLFLILIDIIQTIISLIIKTTYAQNVFMYILEIWIFFFCIALMMALINAKKQTKELLNRAKIMYSNKVMSPRRAPSAETKHNIYNPSSSKYDLRNVSLPKTIHIMDIDGKSIRSKVIDNTAYKNLKQQMIKIYLMMTLNIFLFLMLIIGAIYLYHTNKNMDAEQISDYPKMTESPMSSIGTYLIYTLFSIIYIISLLWWLYIPKSFCCDNIAIDSMFYFCCTYTLSCCFVLQPSELYQNEYNNNNNRNEFYNKNNGTLRGGNMNDNDIEDSTDFDFFNVDTWRSTFRITTYRSMSLISDKGETTQEEEEDAKNGIIHHNKHDSDPSLSLTDKDYNDIQTRRAPTIPDELSNNHPKNDGNTNGTNGNSNSNGRSRIRTNSTIAHSRDHSLNHRHSKHHPPNGLSHSQSIQLLSALDSHSHTKLKKATSISSQKSNNTIINNHHNMDNEESVELTIRDRGVSTFSTVSTKL